MKQYHVFYQCPNCGDSLNKFMTGYRKADIREQFKGFIIKAVNVSTIPRWTTKTKCSCK